ncbi:hypothetical protein CHS0354_036928 [Potamilus streckersoni]|uniref:39S ribosomal protein L12, mitochondrial n=1 Tax=Potamilus streckersoni TaxID=2493646 RepID=A0AAE0SRR3_9BIVA|nr:hypothetical protein CHS0354_036928 [Potamilus streckersoni]
MFLVRIFCKSALRGPSCKCRFKGSNVARTTRCLVGFKNYYSTQPAIASPIAEGEAKNFSPKIHKIVDDISKLTLFEVADLNELLKKTLKIQDAPVMMGAAMQAAPVKKEAEEEAEVAPKKEKTTFTVRLTAFDDSKKVTLIKELKNLMSGMNLVQAKKFVESAPQIVKQEIPKEEADKLKAALEAVGGKVEIE